MDLRRNAYLFKLCCVYYYMILLRSRSNQDASLQCYIPRWLDFGFLVIGITFTSLGQNLRLRCSCCTWVVLSRTCTGVSLNLVMLTTCATTCSWVSSHNIYVVYMLLAVQQHVTRWVTHFQVDVSMDCI
jgi:hypothetical protein